MGDNSGINPAGSGFWVAQASRLLAMASRHRELSQGMALSKGAVALVKKFVSARRRNQQARRLCYPEPANSSPHWSFQQAFSLVEVTMALSIAGFCLLVLFGLLPIGLKSNQAAISQTAANGFISAVVADLRATPSTTGTTGTTSQLFSIPIPANSTTATTSSTTLYFSGDGLCSGSLNGQALGSGTTTQSRYKLTVVLTSGTSRAATFASLQVSWPASVNIQANAAGTVQTFVALDRN